VSFFPLGPFFSYNFYGMRIGPVLLFCVAAGWAQTPTASRVVAIGALCSEPSARPADLQCEDDGCTAYLELSAAALNGERILLTGNIHTGSSTVQSVLLRSDDGGMTWEDTHNRIGGAVLDSVQFYDFENGWIAGHELQQRTPRNAFILITGDGGKTWRKVTPFEQNRTGTIDKLVFDSRTHGFMAVDRLRGVEQNLRYELWESMTGGTSWNIRQVDANPVSIPSPDPAPQPLRLRSDARRKTHVLERQSGSEWRPVAEFSTQAGNCDPGAEQPTAPDPPSDTAAGQPPPPKLQ
jgi:hypothetical protein